MKASSTRRPGMSVRDAAVTSVMGPFRKSAVSSQCVSRSPAAPDPASAGFMRQVAARVVSAPHCCL